MFLDQFYNYRHKIIFPDEKKYFDEIIKLFKSKQYRSSYIMTWIMLIEALRYRLALLADSGEKEASNTISKIENMEKQKLSADKEILDGAKRLFLIDDEDFGYFDTFWTKRCLFVHPYYKEPTKAEVETIIKITVDKVLSISAFYRKAFIETEVKKLYVKQYLLNDDNKIKEHIIKILGRIESSLYPFFFKTLLFEIGKVINEDDKKDVLKKLSYYLHEIYNKASKESIKNNFNLNNYIVDHPEELIVGLVYKLNWNSFEVDFKSKIIQYVLENIRKKDYYLKSNQLILNMLAENVIIPDECQELLKLLESLSFPIIRNFLPFSNMLINSMLEELKNNDFQKVVGVIDYINLIECDLYTNIDDIIMLKLGKYLLFNAVAKSWASQTLIKSLSKKKNKLHYKIVLGMLFGQLMIWDINLDFNFEYLDYILDYLNASEAVIDYGKWYEIFKETLPNNSPSKNRSFNEYIAIAEDLWSVDKNDLLKIKGIFKLSP